MANFPGTSRAGFWLLILLVLFMTGATSVNLYLLLTQQGAQTAQEDQEQDEEEEEEPMPPPEPIFVKVGPMTVNLQSVGSSDRFLYTGLSLKVVNEETQATLDTHMPEVHSRLLLLLSSQTAEELTRPGGKENLAGQILAQLEQPLSEGIPPLAVESVLFTDFIVQ